MPTSRDSGMSEKFSGFWCSRASGRQVQAVSRAARARSTARPWRLAPVGGPVVIKLAGLVQDGATGRRQPAIQGLAISRIALPFWTARGLRPVMGLPGP